MFRITRLRDTIRVPPADFEIPVKTALTRQINFLYTGHAIPDVGVAVTLHRIVSTGEERMVPGDGATYIDCEFEMAVFCPELGELLIGRVEAQSAQGLLISMAFFGDIIIPARNILAGTYNGSFWKSSIYDGDFSFRVGDDVRFRAFSVKFSSNGDRPDLSKKDGESEDPFARLQRAPMVVYGSLEGEGLGALEWWA